MNLGMKELCIKKKSQIRLTVYSIKNGRNYFLKAPLPSIRNGESKKILLWPTSIHCSLLLSKPSPGFI